MSESYESYLDSCTRQMMEYLSSSGADEGERQAVISAFSEVLAENIGDSVAIAGKERIIYETSLKYIDGQVAKVVGNSNATYSDYEKAISLCRRIMDMKQFFLTKGWNFPTLSNRDIEQCESVLSQRMESTSIASKISAEDKKIDSLLIEAQRNLEVRTCDEILQLLDDLAGDIQICKQKRNTLPAINNKDTKKVAKKVAGIKKIAEQKESLHQKSFELDTRIQSIVSMPKSAPGNWQEIISICQQQKTYLAECAKKQWPLPSVRFDDLDFLIAQYKHYLAMDSIDGNIYSSRDNLSSNKQYKDFFDACESQISNIQTCKKNGWSIPDLKVFNPGEALAIAKDQKLVHDRAKKRKQILFSTLAIAIIIAGLIIFGVIKSREGKVQIPFDASYAVGADLEDIYSELESAGFENITKKQDPSSWLDSGEVISVTIDNRNEYNKDKYIDPEVAVVITYSNSDRIYVTDILKDWSTKPYLEVQQILDDAGFTNVVLLEVETADKGKEQMSAGLELNGLTYTNEHCYLPKNAPITLSYYTFKIGIGNGNEEFIGQNYEDVVNDLQDSGFTNVQTVQITTGWAEGNTVVGVTVNNKDTYSSSESFDPDVKIVVKYSSNDRIDITKQLENWSIKIYDVVQAALKSAGMTNVTVVAKSTTTRSNNLKVASISVNRSSYTDGDCFVQKSAAIIIEYYKLSITVGQSASDLASNTEGKYSSVVTDLKNKGFTNITVYRNNSLFSGLFTKEGSIESISINGNSEFSDTDSFDYDSQIIIVVNTFKKKGCEDISLIWDD